MEMMFQLKLKSQKEHLTLLCGFGGLRALSGRKWPNSQRKSFQIVCHLSQIKFRTLKCDQI